MANNNGNKMSREEAGRKGGEATAKNHDKEFYQEIAVRAERPHRIPTIRSSTRKSAAKAENPAAIKTITIK